jgi:hypothetical protein
MICLLCDCQEVTTTWIDHRFQYGDAELSCKVPVRACTNCKGEWLDCVGEAIIQTVIYQHRTATIKDDWIAAVEKAAKHALT